MKTKKLTVRLSEEEYKKLKIELILRNQTMQDWFEEIVANTLL